MNSDDIKERYGAALDLTVDQGDEASISATIILKNKETDEIISKTANFIDGIADLSFISDTDPDDLIPLGVYSYQINENFVGRLPNIYPKPNGCEDEEECGLPTLTICEASEEEENS